MTQALYTHKCKIIMYRLKVLKLFITIYFIHNVICKNKIKFINFIICSVR